MPLHPGKGKKAFGENVKIEMEHGKPQKQALAIAYSIKRKGKKKMAEGGEVTISASNEKRPMPNDVHGDSHTVSRNSGNKRPGPDSWTDNPTIKQAQRPSITKLSKPRMVESGVLRTKLHNQEEDLQSAMPPSSDADQPDTDYNEINAKGQGHALRDNSKSHSTKKAPYNQDIEDQYAQDMAEADMKKRQSYAKGGQIEANDYDTWNESHRTGMEPADHGIQEGLREDERHLMDSEDPSEDEGAGNARNRNELGPNRQGDEVPDMEDQHNSGRKPYFMGGPAVKKDHPHLMFEDDEDNMDGDMEMNPAHDHWSGDDSSDQGDMDKDADFYDNDKWDDSSEPNSIAAAIMSRRKGVDPEVGSESDTDEMARMAEGGVAGDAIGESDSLFDFAKRRKPSAIRSHDSIYSDDSSQADMRRNHDEDANEEDQLSFNALRKENYNSSNLDVENPKDSAQMGDSEETDSENEHDHIDEMRRRMKTRRSR